MTDEPAYTLTRILGFQRDSAEVETAEPRAADFFVVVAHANEIIGLGLKTITSNLPRVALSYAFAGWDRAAAMLEPRQHTGKFTDVLIVTESLARDNRRAAAALRAAGTKIVVLLENVTVAGIAGLEADGFLMAGSLTPQGLGDMFGQLASGQIPMPPRLTRGLLAEVERLGNAAAGRHLLTTRETQTLRLLVEGLGNKQIAARLGISVNGVKRHVSNVLAKLNCPNRTQAAAYAVRTGLI